MPNGLLLTLLCALPFVGMLVSPFIPAAQARNLAATLAGSVALGALAVVIALYPAIAGGNSVIIKPASDTPLSALKFTHVLLEAGLPESAVACLTGPGGALGKAICSDDRVRKISFTGSYEVGDAICRAAEISLAPHLGEPAPPPLQAKDFYLS